MTFHLCPWFPRSSVGIHTAFQSYSCMHSHAGAWERDNDFPPLPLVPTVLRGNPYRIPILLLYAFPRGSVGTRHDFPPLPLVPSVLRGNPYRIPILLLYAFPRRSVGTRHCFVCYCYVPSLRTRFMLPWFVCLSRRKKHVDSKH